MPALDRLQAALGGDKLPLCRFHRHRRDRPAGAVSRKHRHRKPAAQHRSLNKIFEDLKSRSLARGLPVTILLDAKRLPSGPHERPGRMGFAGRTALIEAAIGRPQQS
jgi:hypothetical protein